VLSSPSMSSLPIRNGRPTAIINRCTMHALSAVPNKGKRGGKWQKNLTRKNILTRLLDGQPETNPGSSLLSNSPGGYSLSSILSLLYLIMGFYFSFRLARFTWIHFLLVFLNTNKHSAPLQDGLHQIYGSLLFLICEISLLNHML